MTDDQATERNRANRGQKDFWDILGVLSQATLGAVGVVVTIFLYTDAAKQRASDTVTSVLNERERSEMSFRASMFVPLLDRILDSRIPLRQRLEVLELFQQNFHDIFNARASFDALAKDAREARAEDMLTELRRIARDTTRKQVGLVVAAVEHKDLQVEISSPQKKGKFAWFQKFDLLEGQKASITLGSSTDPADSHQLEIALHEVVSDDAARVTLSFLNDDSIDPSTFEVSFYDTPFTDNILLPDRHRLALVLLDVKWRVHPHLATFQVVEFPADYVIGGYKPSLAHINKMIEGVRR